MDDQARKFLGNLWADGSPQNRQTPEEVGIDRAAGWHLPYEQPGTGLFPERTVWNQLIRELQGAFAENMLYGFPRWAADVDYPQWAFCQHNSQIWTATEATGPNQSNPSQSPAPNTIWRQF